MSFPNPNKASRIDWEERYRASSKDATIQHIREYYSAGLPDANSPIASAELVALDFETTGLNPDKDDIISIGLVPFSANAVYCSLAKYWLFKPESPLADDSVAIHGITHSDLIDAPDLLTALDEVLEALAGKLIVVHYRRIEREFFNQALISRTGEGISFPVLDTLQLEHDILESERSLWQKLADKPVGPLRLADCRARYGLPHYEPHHALTDAVATAELMMAQLAHKIPPDTPISHLWV